MSDVEQPWTEEDRQFVLTFLEARPSAAPAEFGQVLELSPPAIAELLSDLVADGLLRQESGRFSLRRSR